MRSRAGPVTEILVFATEISVTGLEIFLIWTLQPGYRDETFLNDLSSQAPHKSSPLSKNFKITFNLVLGHIRFVLILVLHFAKSRDVTSLLKWVYSSAFASKRPKWHNFYRVCISTSKACELALLVKLQESTKLRQSRTILVYVSPFGLVSWISSRSTGLKCPI